jgi:AAA+ superfamily predicted ATPase
VEPFANSYQHLLAELERIDLLIRARVAHLRKLHQQDEHFRGLYISEQEIDGLLARPNGRPAWLRSPDNAWLGGADSVLAELMRAMEQRCEASAASGIPLRIPALRDAFGLSRFELDVLLVSLAGEVDLRYEKLYAYLQDDVTRKRPSVDLVTQLLTSTDAQRLDARRAFHAASPLLRHQLVQLIEDATHIGPPLLARFLKIDDRIVQYLFESNAVDERLREFVEPATSANGLDQLELDALTRGAVRHAWPTAVGPNSPILILSAPEGAGKRAIAEALCADRQLPLLIVDMPALMRDKVRLILREARLRGAALYLHDFEIPGGASEHPDFTAALGEINDDRIPCIIGTRDARDIPAFFPRRGAVMVKIPCSTQEQRRLKWASCLGAASLAENADLGSVASRFRLTLGQVERAAETSVHLARMRGGTDASVSQQDLLEACRFHSNQKLGTLARKIPPHHRWDDIILPPDCIAQLREMCNQINRRDRVYREWGFDGKLALGKGLAVLFSGPSGTGKTMSAGVVAGELGLDLYKIDLSTVISKYIGETEKNLERIFTEAETSNAILFFDEADALFGRRSEVRDSHDRYANIEVAFLLQRMEEYEGVAILATNFRKNMDDAFVRRLHFALEFPFPDMQHRHLIWKGIWPKDVPRADDLDLKWLAERFEMTGGNIKNVAVSAAFLAAEAEEPVNMRHVLRAVRREYQKTGKLMVDESDFGRQHVHA